jgi:type II secretory pathway predicted ATPase ExeA/LysM repeat protein
MLLDYYQLAEQPFGVTPDSRFLYLGPKHREALASLVYGTESNRGFLALIAKPGMGKTSLLYHYLSYLRDKARTAFVFRTDCDSREFIRHVLLDLGIDVKGMDLPAMHDALNRLLTEEMRAGRRFVLVIDEAQNLDESVLESVRLLSNFETPWMKLMQIVLAGQPQLADRLARPSMAQLRQRISMIIRIEPLTHEEVNAYIDHRLYIAGGENNPVFTAGARKLIAEHSEGIPRNINNLCFNAMSLGCALKRKTIDRDIINDVIADLDLESLREAPVVAEPAKTSAVQTTKSDQTLSVLTAAPKNESTFTRFAPKVALASAAVIALSWAAVHAMRPVTRAAESRASAPVLVIPVSATLPPPTATVSLAASEPANSLATLPSANVAPVATTATPLPDQSSAVNSPSAPASASSQSVRVTQGLTLYRLSVKQFGKYNQSVLQEIRDLNPWLQDPNHIRPGQTIRIPSAKEVSTDSPHAAEQATGAAPAETGKKQ